MSESAERFVFSLQSRLILAFTFVVTAALIVAGGVFVVMERDAARERELALAVGTAPLIAQDLIRLPAPDQELARLLEGASVGPGVRLFIVRSDGTVLADSATATLGAATHPARPLLALDHFSPGELLRVAGSDVVVTGVFDAALPGAPPGDTRLLTSVTTSRLDQAWLALLPQLGLAGAIALPLAVALAVLLARYITDPLDQLTRATDQVATGHIPDGLPTERRDELGRLARAFVATAERVGEGNARMRRLIADVSHDLRTPLTPIAGYAKALRDGVAEGPAAARAGAVIFEEATRLEGRLGDLLLAAELESGQALLEVTPCDLAAVAQGVLARSAQDAAGRSLHLSSNLGHAPSDADVRKIERAIENLVTNAIRYTPVGGSLHVRTEATATEVRIQLTNSVDDSVQPQALTRFFDRFYRGLNGGSGLGLAIARDVATLHGGTLEATLNDRLITFTLTIPVAGPARAAPSPTN